MKQFVFYAAVVLIIGGVVVLSTKFYDDGGVSYSSTGTKSKVKQEASRLGINNDWANR
ncbi:MAG: hypothetical protein OEZ43_00195 [Gammaproteobacteria bacterium]|nr:hypothetical protein [Gammaproteobacteria bacterium]